MKDVKTAQEGNPQEVEMNPQTPDNTPDSTPSDITEAPSSVVENPETTSINGIEVEKEDQIEERGSHSPIKPLLKPTQSIFDIALNSNTATEALQKITETPGLRK